MTEDHERWMRLAISLGKRGLGRVWPNPAVGCVLVKGGRIVGRGWTQDGGRPHAEVMALQQAGKAANAATAYVSLEPCSHHGKTPPCAEALVAAGVRRVVTALEDPDPRVSGRGHALLRGAGVEVVTDVLSAEARCAQAGFLSRVRRGRPFVTLKLAMSLDGRIATASGESKWITGPEARRMVHAMRACHDAVLVGAGTVRADNPSLTVRDLGVARQPIRVVASRWLDLPVESELGRTAYDVPLWLLHGKGVEQQEIWTRKGARLIEVPGRTRDVDPNGMMEALGKAGLTRIFCEGGGKIAASLLAANLVDRLILFSAGLVLGAEGWPGVAALGLEALADAERFILRSTHQVGTDVMQVWERQE